jgi:ribosomal protein uL13
MLLIIFLLARSSLIFNSVIVKTVCSILCFLTGLTQLRPHCNPQTILFNLITELNISTLDFMFAVKFDAYSVKAMNTNPRRGPFHHRAPARLLWKVIRGMLPHTQPRGAAALARLKLFEGVPDAYAKVAKKVISFYSNPIIRFLSSVSFLSFSTTLRIFS